MFLKFMTTHVHNISIALYRLQYLSPSEADDEGSVLNRGENLEVDLSTIAMD